ncbi:MULTISPECIES: hypothetical protein [Thioclava]|uniref:Lipoprotein n=1 Tax=Thioclava electrotropha TaxID=1549850 RepID=A0ABX6YNU9_9RHOB|nr:MULTISPECIES: hypothetical protein [Thioclava]QPZ89410.1 hypothetical protein AKL02_012775 [Thioclava electrotropha]
MVRISLGAVACAALLVGCAPKPEPAPVTVEPVYTGKYGGPVASGGSCRPTGRLVDSQYPASVPDCPLECGPLETATAATAQRPAQCVPEPRGGSMRQPTGTPRSTTPNDPTRG